jgi:hypothetical protein
MKQQFFQDFEVDTSYQMHVYVCFVDPESRNRIPKSGSSFTIPAPVIEDRPGGPGLDDIKHLLEVKDRDPSFEFTQGEGRLIGVRIIRSGMLFIVPLTFSFTKREKNSYIIEKDYFTYPKNKSLTPSKQISEAFLRWRGFHKLKRISVSNDTKEGEWLGKPVWEQACMRAAIKQCAKFSGLPNPAVTRNSITHKNDGKKSDSSPASASKDSPKSSSPTAHENDGKVSNSSPASMDLPESSSPTTLDIPISHESTSKSTQPHSLQTEISQPPSHSPSEPAPLEPTILPPGQLTPEQKKSMQRQMSRAKQLVAKTKQTAGKKARKSKKELEEKPKDPMLDNFPEEPLEPASKGIVAGFWKMLGR